MNSQVDVRSHSLAKPLRKARADFTLNKLLTASDQGTTWNMLAAQKVDCEVRPIFKIPLCHSPCDPGSLPMENFHGIKVALHTGTTILTAWMVGT